MNISISKRKLKGEEIDLFINEIKNFPNPVAPKRRQWEVFDPVYILSKDSELIGICSVTRLKKWVKLGPFVILRKYQGKGYGKTIIEAMVKDYSNDNLFIGSRNPHVGKIAADLGFKEVNKLDLPDKIKSYLVRNMLDNLSVNFIKELIRKKSIKEGKYRCFLKPNLKSTKLNLNKI